MTSLEKFTALVVDDQRPSREIVRLVLRELQMKRIFLADNGETAREMVDHEDVDMVICDWEMPHMSGYQLLQHVRKNYPGMPFMMVTGRGDKDSVQDAIRAGVTDYIVKPFKPQKLSGKLIHLADKCFTAIQEKPRSTARTWST